MQGQWGELNVIEERKVAEFKESKTNNKTGSCVTTSAPPDLQDTENNPDN